MKKLLTPIVCLLFISCEKRIDFNPPIINYTLSIDSVLTRDGLRSLPKDTNGIYHLKIVTNGLPQSHRVVGKILANGVEPYPPQRVEFESNLYWWLRRGDTTATITQAYINYFTGQYTIIQLPPMIASKDELVPTSNCCSISGTRGSINNMISPIREMIGDTMVLKATHTISNKIVYTKIVLE